MPDNPTTAPDVAELAPNKLQRLRDRAEYSSDPLLAFTLPALLDSHDALTAQVAALTARCKALEAGLAGWNEEATDAR